MKKLRTQIERIKKIQHPLYISIDKTFKSIFKSPFMTSTFLTLYRDSSFFLIYLVPCLGIFSIIIQQFTRKHFSHFFNLQKNITRTVRLSNLDPN